MSTSFRTFDGRIGWLLMALAALLMTQASCGEEPAAQPLSLRSPLSFVFAPTCIEGDVWQPVSSCPNEALLDGRGYVTNEESGSLAFVRVTDRGGSLIDTRAGVPGVTPVPIGRRPAAAAGTDDGAFVLTVNSGSSDISIVEAAQAREIVSVSTDGPASDLVRDPVTRDFWLAYPSGRLELRRLAYECDGASGPNVYTNSCELDRDDVTFDIVDAVDPSGSPRSLLVDGEARRLYVAYADRLYVSIFALAGSEEACLDAAESAPCEVSRLPGGFGCADGIDNDGDGFIDGQDPQCYTRAGAESPDGVGTFGTTACNDLEDNDADGLFDGFDPGCAGTNDDSEASGDAVAPTPSACLDGMDNDGDGLIDNRDPDCTGPDDENESGPGLAPACNDGVDNDGDGDVDFPDDEGCANLRDESEDDVRGCVDGVDNDGDGLVDFPEDAGCSSPDDVSETRSPGRCNDGVDNDGDGLVDLADDGCYGANGATEDEVERIGLGPLGIDPQRRWLYVIDRSEWQLLVIDLETERLIDAGARNPYTALPGVRVNPLPHAVAGDVRTNTLVQNEAGARVDRDEAVALVATTAGTLDVVSIHQTFRRVGANDAVTNTAETFTLRIGDNDGENQGRVINTRCVRRLCEDNQLPEIELRKRPTVQITENAELIAYDEADPLEEAVITPADSIFVDEAWQVIYEGVLPNSDRTDGVITEPGILTSNGNFCRLGVQPGDRLIIKSNPSTSSDACLELASQIEALDGLPEWEIAAVRAGTLVLRSLAEDGDEPAVELLPTRECYPFGTSFEIRPVDTWVLDAEATQSLLARDSRDGVCVNPIDDSLGRGRLATGTSLQTGLFEITIPDAAPEERGATFEFGVRDGYSPLRRGIGPLPGDLDVVEFADRRFLFVPDAGADQVFIFDADSLSSFEPL